MNQNKSADFPGLLYLFLNIWVLFVEVYAKITILQVFFIVFERQISFIFNVVLNIVYNSTYEW